VNPERVCRSCGRSVTTTPSGHLRAHACPHGHGCVLSYRARRLGRRPRRCGACFVAKQLALWPAEDEL
jgi:hypothetical protein